MRGGPEMVVSVRGIPPVIIALALLMMAASELIAILGQLGEFRARA